MSNYIADYNNFKKYSDIGNKAFGLGILWEMKVDVPEWLVIRPQILFDSIDRKSAEVIKKGENRDEIFRIIDKIEFKREFLEEIEEEIGFMSKNGESYFAVRSSTVDEDSVAASFAGQYESYLYVPKEKIIEKIKEVWKSAYAERVLGYKREQKKYNEIVIPGVIIQKMVNAECAGVVFTKVPVTDRNLDSKEELIISSNYGLGTSVVSGEASVDTFYLNEKFEVIKKFIGEKEYSDKFNEKSKNGLKKREIEKKEREKSSLEEKTIKKIAEIAKKIEKHMGEPQDIEWALEGEEIYILQSRPITTLTKEYNRVSKFPEIIWDNSNIIESYSGITLPLTYSFIRNAYAKVYETTCKVLNVDKKIILENKNVFECMLGYINGRVYYNLINWYSLISLFPGFGKNKKFMEQMMGVKKELPENILERFNKKGIKERINILKTSIGLIKNFITINRKTEKFHKRVDNVLNDGNKVENMCGVELIEYYKKLESKLLYNWDVPIINDFFAMMFFGMLKELIVKWNIDKSGYLQNDLISENGGMVSAEPSKYIDRMYEEIKRDIELENIFKKEDSKTILEELRLKKGSLREALKSVAETNNPHPPFGHLLPHQGEGKKNSSKTNFHNVLYLERSERKGYKYERFYKIYDEYIKKFGCRTTTELKLESESIEENPEMLFMTLKSKLAESENINRGKNTKDSSEKIVSEKLRNKPIKRIIFEIILHLARKHLKMRENLRLERTKVFGKVRIIVRAFGKIFEEEGIIEKVDDIFYLEIEEVFRIISGNSTFKDIKELVQLRKKNFDAYKELELPERFKTRGAIDNNVEILPLLKTEEYGIERRKGLGCSSGKVRGVVQVVLNPNGTNIEKGRIIVAKSTDPGWVLVFPLAKGLLVERGSLLSHSAIVARELGIPAIVSIPKVTEWLKDGDIVEFDGTTGEVILLEGGNSK